MPDPIAPATPATPASAAPAAAPAAPPSSTAAPAQTPAAATSEKPIAAAASPEPSKPAEPPKRPDSLIPDPAAEGAKPAEAGAPEKYEFKAPEGVTLDPGALGEFETFAKEKNLSQDMAQSLLDRHVAEIKKQTEGIYNSWFETQKGWQAEIIADKNIGGDKLPASKAAIGRVLNFLGPVEGKAFREALDFTGAGNNPAVFRGLVKLAERFSEGTSVKGNPTTAALPKTAASVLYPPKG